MPTPTPQAPKANSTRHRSTKAGLPPGTLVHIGKRRAEEATVSVISYDEGGCQEWQAKTEAECVAFKDRPATTWLSVTGLHRVELVEKIGQCYGLHPLLLEDVLNTEQRPKLEDYGDYIFVVLKTLSLDGDERLKAEQVSVVLGQSFVISFQEGASKLFEPIRERIRAGKVRIRKLGADYLAYALIDTVIDGYFAILERLGERIELLEEELVSDPTTGTIHAIHDLKRDMIFLRRSVWPLREVVSALVRADSGLIQRETAAYLRDTYDHTIQVIDTIESYRDMVSGMIDIYLSSVSNRMNEVMKVLTVIATIFIPLTFLVGVYGMNFRHMPELDLPWAYPALWGLMIAIVAGMVVYFRRTRWGPGGGGVGVPAV
jgi:magnesium transporter